MQRSTEWVTRRLNSDISEIALNSDSREQFRDSVLETVCRAMGFDHGGLYSVGAEHVIAAQMWNIAAEPITSRIGIYMSEMTSAEASRIRERSVLDSELFGARRCRLAAYDEYIFRERVSGYIARLWDSRLGAGWITLGRVGTATFNSRDTDLLDLLYPIIQLGEALHAQGHAEEAIAQREWAYARGVNPTQWQAVELVLKGFTNGDIARLLGRSPNTVRNQLHRVFESLDVTTRTELAMALHTRPADLPDGSGKRWKNSSSILRGRSTRKTSD